MARRRQSIQTALKESIPQGCGVLVAYSGGKDSSVLLDALVRNSRLLKVRVEACHIDHALRPSSGDDAGFCTEVARQLGVECHVATLGVRPQGANLEAWGRDQRYKVLREVRISRKLDWIVTAHTANDVAETLLIRLFANKELNSIERRDGQRRLMRPLLGVSRSQIEEYLSRHGLEFREDPTNADVTLVRNRIRHTLLPRLEQDFDPSMVWILAERAHGIASDCDALQALASESAARLGGLQGGNPAWLTSCAQVLEQSPYGLQWRIAEALTLPITGYRMGEKAACEVVGLLLGRVPSVQLRAGITLSRDRFGLVWGPQRAKSSRLSEA